LYQDKEKKALVVCIKAKRI